MSEPRFAQVSYVRATPEEVWSAFTDPAVTSLYWFGKRLESTWHVGSPIAAIDGDGQVSHSGEVLACERPKRLSFSWRVDFEEKLKREGHSRMTFELEPEGEVTRLTLIHDEFAPGSTVAELVGMGWPMMIASLKSLIETGEPLDAITGAEATRAAKKLTVDTATAAVE
jgi:uncharacterized protein YndB with AHSA1/START domain